MQRMNTSGFLAFDNGIMGAGSIRCDCGREHRLDLDEIRVGTGALTALKPALSHETEASGDAKVCLVADSLTYEAAGSRVESLLEGAGAAVERTLIDQKHPGSPAKTDEVAVGSVLMDLPRDTSLMVAAGSGTITDVTRIVAARAGLPFWSIPTAPSVDAYTSDTSPMTRLGLKRSTWGTIARRVFADTDVLCKAPAPMVASGFGDTVAKLVSRLDWQLSAIVTGEYYCPVLEGSVTAATRGVVGRATGLAAREPSAIELLTESLMVSGAAMVILGDSRSAAGAEHAISHYLEMKSGAGKSRRAPLLHGTKVGVGTVIMASFWRHFGRLLDATDPDSLKGATIQQKRRSPSEIRTALNEDLGAAGEILFTRVTQKRIPSAETSERYLSRMISAWEEMRGLASEAPAAGELSSLLHSAGGPALPSEINVDSDELRETLYGACEVRDRYTVLTVAEELGWFGGIVDAVAEELAG